MAIHPTAIVSRDAHIDPSVDIGANVIIESDVILDKDVRIMANAYLCSGVEIGEGTSVHVGAVIGNEPQDYSYKGEKTKTKIGKNCIIREYVTVHRGSGEGTSTVVGNNNMLMVSAHLGHNCETEENVIIANGALLAGHVKVEKGAFISGNVVFHQFCRIGRYAMIGGFTGVNKDVPPYMIVRGPSVIRGINLVGLRRAGIPREAIKEIKEAYKTMFLSGESQEDALVSIKKIMKTDEVAHFIEFIEQSKRNICRYRYDKEEYF